MRMVFGPGRIKGIPSEVRPELDICRRRFSARLFLFRAVGILDKNNRDHPPICRTARTSVPEMKVEGDHITRLRLAGVGWNSTDIVPRFSYIVVDFIM